MGHGNTLCSYVSCFHLHGIACSLYCMLCRATQMDIPTASAQQLIALPARNGNPRTQWSTKDRFTEENVLLEQMHTFEFVYNYNIIIYNV